MTPVEEASAIKKVLSGNADAFEPLVTANQKNVYNLALRMTGSEQDAQDIAQEAFLKAYINLGTFRGGSRFSVWLYRLTYNLCIDLLRREKRGSVISLSARDDGDGADFDIPDIRPTPETEAERRELQCAVKNAMEELNPDHRQILSLREGAGMSYADISAVLGINEGSVKSRLNRARRALAKTLVKNGTFSPDKRQITGKEG